MQEETATVNQGRNVKRIREILGIKQDALAKTLGLSQQAISQLEAKESLDRDMLNKIAEALKVSPEAIQNFNEEKTFNIFSNNFHDHAINLNYQCTFNPIEKLVEAMEENKKLYERLLESEREKVALLQKMLDQK